MKEHIYTIPVTEAFEKKGECPFCNMHEILSKDAVDYMLGPSYMEGDIRMDTNAQGFCQHHYEKMFAEQNRLGLSIMVHTHLKKINTDLSAMLKNHSAPAKKKIFTRPAEDKTDEAMKHLEKVSNSCYICNRISNTFDRYIDTYFYLWKQGEDIKELTRTSNGFCLNHFSTLMETGKKMLSSTAYGEFLSIIIPLELENLKRLEDDIEWFINKFDYRNVDEPWKNSKDSLARCLLKIASLHVNGD